jgi:hypothetical protein
MDLQLMAHRCSHPSKQFIHPKRFGWVIVSAEIQRLNLTDLVAATRQNDNRDNVVAPPDPSQEIMTVDMGQPKIEDDQGRVLRQQLERDLGIGSFEDVVALRIQSHSEKLADRWLVIDNKHLNLVGTHAAVSNGSAPAGMAT